MLLQFALACGPGGTSVQDTTPPPNVEPTDAPTPTSPPTSTPGGGTTGLPVVGLTSLSAEGVVLAPAFDLLLYRYNSAIVNGRVHLEAIPTPAEAVVSISHATLDGDVMGTGPDVDLLLTPLVVVDVTLGEQSAQYQLLAVPPDFPQLGTLAASGGEEVVYFGLQGPAATPYPFAADSHGTFVWYHPVVEAVWDVRLGPAGRRTWIEEHLVEPYSGVVLDPATGDILTPWFSSMTSDGRGTSLDVHELIDFGDHAILIATWAEVADLRDFGGDIGSKVRHFEVQEVGSDGSIAFRWSTESIFVPEEIGLWVEDEGSGELDYAHLNGVDVDPYDGNWVISLRLFDQVIKVARNDGTLNGVAYQAGDVLWRVGGPDATLDFVDDDRDSGWIGFAGQHSPRMVAPDRLLLFDNAFGREAVGDLSNQDISFFATGGTRAVEYALDLVAGTATPVWSHDLEDGVFTLAGGSVQRLADGSTAIGWGTRYLESGGPAMTRVADDGTVLSGLTLPKDVWSYRAWVSVAE